MTVLNTIVIEDLADVRLRDYTQLTDVALRKLLEPESGLYLAESIKVIERALDCGHTPRSILSTEDWLPTLEQVLKRHPDVAVYVGTSEQLETLTGFHLHRGAIASMHRPELPSAHSLLTNAKTILILENVVDHTNVGAIFRSAAALGADAVFVTTDSADPLYRRAVRVSMGAVLQVPWTRIENWGELTKALQEFGFTTAALALHEDAIDLREFASHVQETDRNVALILGSEGRGLSKRALHSADTIVTIPMHHGVDSLNVANAAGIALWSVQRH